MDADGSNERRAGGFGPWLPDGKRIVTVQRESRTSPGRLTIMNLDGSVAHEIPTSDMMIGTAEPVGDGKTLAVGTAKLNSAGRVASIAWSTMNIDGSNVRPIPLPAVSGRMLGLKPSHDGRRVAYVVADTSDPSTPFRSTTLYVMNIDGSGNRSVVTLPDGLEQITWSHDDKKIAMQHDDHMPRIVPPDFVPNGNIVVVDVATGAAKELAQHDRRYADETPSWSPDGHIYFQSDRDGAVEIYRMKEDGSEQTRISHSPR
jgi:Tol biopolymer transport system component